MFGSALAFKSRNRIPCHSVPFWEVRLAAQKGRFTLIRGAQFATSPESGGRERPSSNTASRAERAQQPQFQIHGQQTQSRHRKTPVNTSHALMLEMIHARRTDRHGVAKSRTGTNESTEVDSAESRVRSTGCSSLASCRRTVFLDLLLLFFAFLEELVPVRGCVPSKLLICRAVLLDIRHVLTATERVERTHIAFGTLVTTSTLTGSAKSPSMLLCRRDRLRAL